MCPCGRIAGANLVCAFPSLRTYAARSRVSSGRRVGSGTEARVPPLMTGPCDFLWPPRIPLPSATVSASQRRRHSRLAAHRSLQVEKTCYFAAAARLNFLSLCFIASVQCARMSILCNYDYLCEIYAFRREYY